MVIYFKNIQNGVITAATSEHSVEFYRALSQWREIDKDEFMKLLFIPVSLRPIEEWK